MDLAAINIQRARDLGLGTLNQTREALGLDPYSYFYQITGDPETLGGLQAAYGNVNNVGLWTGGLSENHEPGALVGETFQPSSRCSSKRCATAIGSGSRTKALTPRR